MTSKTSRKSGLSVTNMEDVIKFKLVEDLSLVTVPVTTCLIVLVTYIFCGAALFSAWEVSQSKLLFIFDYQLFNIQLAIKLLIYFTARVIKMLIYQLRKIIV